mmetsp:Transcript_41641/g.64979  ORF Transcript_41641/g.64979 Transcript_41641/m.64979 type:complete len:229 (+) Transcript_41641:563-1249(+)|eukprot:CAMPEP_0184296766 /NCGR_PEP_ID=MMETSP1049-20130417/7728_1 /TAXON_ID=77928 /ORGANISM="Proteomonas sulcata, Strain CCMP704" /LENGTH=228 /DNA_ID=CAMNT_0026606169 /DNA_START=484 /DNA_END=1170 /DNA_ORIENTATION=+
MCKACDLNPALLSCPMSPKEQGPESASKASPAESPPDGAKHPSASDAGVLKSFMAPLSMSPQLNMALGATQPSSQQFIRHHQMLLSFGQRLAATILQAHVRRVMVNKLSNHTRAQSREEVKVLLKAMKETAPSAQKARAPEGAGQKPLPQEYIKAPNFEAVKEHRKQSKQGHAPWLCAEDWLAGILCAPDFIGCMPEKRKSRAETSKPRTVVLGNDRMPLANDTTMLF